MMGLVVVPRPQPTPPPPAFVASSVFIAPRVVPPPGAPRVVPPPGGANENGESNASETSDSDSSSEDYKGKYEKLVTKVEVFKDMARRYKARTIEKTKKNIDAAKAVVEAAEKKKASRATQEHTKATAIY